MPRCEQQPDSCFHLFQVRIILISKTGVSNIKITNVLRGPVVTEHIDKTTHKHHIIIILNILSH